MTFVSKEDSHRYSFVFYGTNVYITNGKYQISRFLGLHRNKIEWFSGRVCWGQNLYKHKEEHLPTDLMQAVDRALKLKSFE